MDRAQERREAERRSGRRSAVPGRRAARGRPRSSKRRRKAAKRADRGASSVCAPVSAANAATRELAHRVTSSDGARYESASATCSAPARSAPASAAAVWATRATRALPRPDNGSRSTARASSSSRLAGEPDRLAPQPCPSRHDTRPNRRRRLARRASELPRTGAGHGDDEVEAVEQSTRELVAEAREPLRRAGALCGRVASRTARAQVHRPDQLEARRKLCLAARAGDADHAVLERLAERLQRRPRELGELVEQQHAVVGEARLARPRAGAASDDRGRRRSVVRSTERRRGHERRLWAEQSCNGMDPGDLDRLRLAERRQDPGQPSREHRLARPGGPGEQEIVASRGCELERATRTLLAPHVCQIGRLRRGPAVRRRIVGRRVALAAEVGGHLGEMPNRHGLDPREGRLGRRTRPRR